MPSLFKVQFAHGLEGSPNGTKSRLLAQEFNALTPVMNTQDFDACVQVHADRIAGFSPQVLVGSSFGGAVVLALLQRGLWQGPTLLLAQAGLRVGLPATLPPQVRVWLVHGTADDIIDPQDSQQLAAAGEPSHVRLIEVEDDHPLTNSVANGDLVKWVNELAMLS